MTTQPAPQPRAKSQPVKDPISRFADYIAERERIRLKKEAGDMAPWTTDPILRQYKFTNVHREHDRTSRFFKAVYDANSSDSAEIVLLNCMINRYFGTVEFQQALGWQRKWEPAKVIALARQRLNAKEKVFTGAYLISNCGRTDPKEEVVCDFIGGGYARATEIVECFSELASWKQAYLVLSDCDGFGGSGFMAKEVLQDFLMTKHGGCSDRDTFTPVGPGARRGINRILGLPLQTRHGNEDKWLAKIHDIQVQLNSKLSGTKVGKLTAHEVQFGLCEFDKYERVRLGQGRPRSLYRAGQGGV